MYSFVPDIITCTRNKKEGMTSINLYLDISYYAARISYAINCKKYVFSVEKLKAPLRNRFTILPLASVVTQVQSIIKRSICGL